MKTTDTGKIEIFYSRSKELLGVWWGGINSASSLLFWEERGFRCFLLLISLLTANSTVGDEGGENGHLPVLLDSEDEPPAGAIHRFEISKITGQSVSNSNVSVNHQGILLRCCRLR